jgi:hypothetical protein
MASDEAQQLGAQLQANYSVKHVYGVGDEVLTGSSNVYMIHEVECASGEAPPTSVLKQQMGRGGQVSCRAAASPCTAKSCGDSNGVSCICVQQLTHSMSMHVPFSHHIPIAGSMCCRAAACCMLGPSTSGGSSTAMLLTPGGCSGSMCTHFREQAYIESICHLTALLEQSH